MENNDKEKGIDSITIFDLSHSIEEEGGSKGETKGNATFLDPLPTVLPPFTLYLEFQFVLALFSRPSASPATMRRSLEKIYKSDSIFSHILHFVSQTGTLRLSLYLCLILFLFLFSFLTETSLLNENYKLLY